MAGLDSCRTRASNKQDVAMATRGAKPKMQRLHVAMSRYFSRGYFLGYFSRGVPNQPSGNVENESSTKHGCEGKPWKPANARRASAPMPQPPPR